MYNSLISVIVPIYNVEEYICQCIDSIIAQTYVNLEIILVDDGSTDASGLICDSYIDRDKRVKVIHKENGGLSDARNTGFQASNGEYILFFDSDDYVDTRIVEIMAGELEDSKYDCVACEYHTFTDKLILERNYKNIQKKKYTGKNLLLELYTGQLTQIGFVAWNKLYKRELFEKHNIEYPKGRIYEDTYTTYKLIYFSNEICVLNIPLYFYRIRKGSIMNSSVSLKKCQDGMEGDLSSVDFFKSVNDNVLFELALSNFYRSAIITYNQLKNENNYECIEYLRGKYSEIWNLYQYKGSIIKRLLFWLFCKFPKISYFFKIFS